MSTAQLASQDPLEVAHAGLAAVFRDVAFVPTGGVSAKNLSDYLDVPAVLACGGSWITPADAIESGDFNRITDLAKEAVAIASDVRG